VLFQTNAADYDAVTIPDAVIDITAELCPMTFVRTRLALDRLQTGQILAVKLRGEEPEHSVPRQAAELGHTILLQTKDAAGVTLLLLRRK
jgi:TusA-related sulfurtransferase